MTTVNVDLAALTFTSPELARFQARSTNAAELKSVAAQAILDANKALQNINDLCDSTNQTAVTAIQAKLLP